MGKTTDFSGWATRYNIKCADGSVYGLKVELLEELFYGLLNTLVLNGVSCLVFLRVDLESLDSVEILGKCRIVLTALESVKAVSIIDDIIGIVLKSYV